MAQRISTLVTQRYSRQAGSVVAMWHAWLRLTARP